ncbi:MAG: hypothetical protein ABIF85_02785 [Nanoarchaeota archaeon]|nr:hypothetical protein [Nanoarchaeota archaeon]MBU4300151.1 hypothetical protein [Nanoarchaeota archaeon]MBU4451565.1 hypothetical protein [Nanoarchaeota archaeon]MCG2724357.1 hypothetical protein [archaeon]
MTPDIFDRDKPVVDSYVSFFDGYATRQIGLLDVKKQILYYGGLEENIAYYTNCEGAPRSYPVSLDRLKQMERIPFPFNLIPVEIDDSTEVRRILMGGLTIKRIKEVRNLSGIKPEVTFSHKDYFTIKEHFRINSQFI